MTETGGTRGIRFGSVRFGSPTIAGSEDIQAEPLVGTPGGKQAAALLASPLCDRHGHSSIIGPGSRCPRCCCGSAGMAARLPLVITGGLPSGQLPGTPADDIQRHSLTIVSGTLRSHN